MRLKKYVTVNELEVGWTIGTICKEGYIEMRAYTDLEDVVGALIYYLNEEVIDDPAV